MKTCAGLPWPVNPSRRHPRCRSCALFTREPQAGDEAVRPALRFVLGEWLCENEKRGLDG